MGFSKLMRPILACCAALLLVAAGIGAARATDDSTGIPALTGNPQLNCGMQVMWDLCNQLGVVINNVGAISTKLNGYAQCPNGVVVTDPSQCSSIGGAKSWTAYVLGQSQCVGGLTQFDTICAQINGDGSVTSWNTQYRSTSGTPSLANSVGFDFSDPCTSRGWAVYPLYSNAAALAGTAPSGWTIGGKYYTSLSCGGGAGNPE